MSGIYEEYSFIFDIDGTLCPIKKNEEKYEDLVPYTNMVKKIEASGYFVGKIPACGYN